MKVQDINTILDMQALQGLSKTSTTTEESSPGTIFQELLQTYVTDTESGTNSQKLGSVNEILSNFVIDSLTSLYDSQSLGSIDDEISNTTNSQGIYALNLLPGIIPASLTTETTSANQASTANKSTTASNYDSIISQASTLYNLPKKLINSVIQQESNFNSSATSSAGASGLMQLMPATAKGLGVTDLLDPEQNIMAGTKYLSQMMDKYNGNTELALAAYNAGQGNVDKYNGIPPFKETQNYVKKVMNTYLS